MKSDQNFKKSNLKFKILSVCLGGVLSLILIESILQIASIYVNHSEKNEYFKNHKYRLVTLGESTTEYHKINGVDVSWPGQLEVVLNRKNNNSIKVYNLGKSSTRVSFIKENLKKEIDKIQPQIVIAMMGINDIEALSYLNTESFFGGLKIIKIIKWIKGSFYQSRIPNQHEHGKIYDTVKSIDLEKSNLEIKTQIDRGLGQFKRNIQWFYMREVANKLYKKSILYNFSGSSNLEFVRYNDLAHDMAREAFDLSGMDHLSLRLMLITCRKDNPSQMQSFLDKLNIALEKGMEIENSTTAMFLTIFNNHPELNKYSKKLGYSVNQKIRAIDQLRIDYREIAEFLNSKKIQLVVMSYPTVKIDIFKSFFAKGIDYDAEHIGGYLYREIPKIEVEPQFSNIIFISNENFLEIKDLLKPNYIFTDLFTAWFGGKFGHTTALGHSIIVENILNNLEAKNFNFGSDFKK